MVLHIFALFIYYMFTKCVVLFPKALSTMASLMEECWHPIPEARLTARRVMKNLDAVPVKETPIS